MMKLIYKLAKLFKRRRVVLIDFDGVITIVWAKESSFGLTCYRYPMGYQACLLRADGTVAGPSYVERWEYYER